MHTHTRETLEQDKNTDLTNDINVFRAASHCLIIFEYHTHTRDERLNRLQAAI